MYYLIEKFYYLAEAVYDIDLKLHASAYSFHTLPFESSFKPQVFFMFRLQVVGSCRVLVDGKMRLVQPGDLLVYRPGEAYHLAVEEIDGKVESGDCFSLCEGSWIENWWKEYNCLHSRESIWMQGCSLYGSSSAWSSTGLYRETLN